MQRPISFVFPALSIALAPIALALGCAETMEQPAQTVTAPPANSTPATAASSAPASAPSAANEPATTGAVASLFDRPKDDGLRFEDLHVGVGPSIQMGDFAKVHYVGKLEDGTEFDSSRRRGEAFEFVLGKGMVIRGFERGMVGMKIGGVRRISIPWQLGYGEKGSAPKIPPRANLVFEIELIDIPVPPPKAEPPKGQRQG